MFYLSSTGRERQVKIKTNTIEIWKPRGKKIPGSLITKAATNNVTKSPKARQENPRTTRVFKKGGGPGPRRQSSPNLPAVNICQIYQVVLRATW
jgi:hypothetical protein